MSEAPDETTQEQDGPEPEPTPGEPTPGEEEEADESEEVEGREGEPAEPESEREAVGAVGAVGEKEIEKMLKGVERANVAYLKKLEGTLGDELQTLEVCPCCGDPFIGLIWPTLMKPLSVEKKDAIRAFIGEAAAQVSEPDQFSRRCESCDGWGRVLSGSRLNSEQTLVCVPCKGHGWVPVGDERRVGRPDLPVPVSTNGPPEIVEQPPDTDPWGRTPGDPDYGRMPQYVGRS